MTWRSGAALVAAGTVGVLVWAAMPQGRAEALAAQTPRVFEFIAGGSRLGVSVRDLDQGAAAATGGVLVEDVTTGSAAEQGGIRKGDVIVEFDGERVRSARQFARLVQETPPARATPLTVIRDGQRSSLSVTPREPERSDFQVFDDLAGRMGDLRFRVTPPPPPAPPQAPAPEDWRLGDLLGGGARLGVTLTPLSPQLAKHFGAEHGVLVSSVAEGSAAEKAGIRAGDVITALNGNAVRSPAELRRAVGLLGQGGAFTVSVVRDRKTLTLEGTVESSVRRRGSTTRL